MSVTVSRCESRALLSSVPGVESGPLAVLEAAADGHSGRLRVDELIRVAALSQSISLSGGEVGVALPLHKASPSASSASRGGRQQGLPAEGCLTGAFLMAIDRRPGASHRLMMCATFP
jgi:hypothetical protein